MCNEWDPLALLGFVVWFSLHAYSIHPHIRFLSNFPPLLSCPLPSCPPRSSFPFKQGFIHPAGCTVEHQRQDLFPPHRVWVCLWICSEVSFFTETRGGDHLRFMLWRLHWWEVLYVKIHKTSIKICTACLFHLLLAISCWDGGAGWGVRATRPSKQRFFQGQTEGYDCDTSCPSSYDNQNSRNESAVWLCAVIIQALQRSRNHRSWGQLIWRPLTLHEGLVGLFWSSLTFLINCIHSHCSTKALINPLCTTGQAPNAIQS